MTDPIEAVARAMEANMWRPITEAPTDGALVLVLTNSVQDLPAFITACAYHPDAGWCVDELREPVSFCFFTDLSAPALARAAIAAFLDAVREPSDVMKRVPLNLPLDGSCVDIWPMTVDALRAELLPPPVEKIGDV